jgi:4-hydroxy-2-oxoheptanedioate aldolase
MRQNRFAELLAGGDVLFGAHLPFPSPDLVEFCGHLGFDWVFIDAEHGVIGSETSQELVRAADGVGIGSLVRVPATTASVVLGYLESGANIILAPHVMTAATASELVSSVRYWPEGSRGSYSGSRAANWGLTQSPPDYFAAFDRHALPMAMLEDVSAYDHLDDLCAVPGLDLFFLGAGDLSMSMGLPGQASHPQVVERIGAAAATLRSHGKQFGAMAPTAASVEPLVGMGCRMLAVSSGALLASAARDYLAQAREILKSTKNRA